jgi:chloramphenicol 3-O-phosphotransferase
MTEDVSTAVMVWWAALRAVSVLNILVWVTVAAAWWRTRDGRDPGKRSYQATQLALSALFVGGCAFRSFLPWAEAPRYCLSGSPFSSAAIARTVATVAELALVTQWALTMREMALQRKVNLAFAAACLIVPMIVFAEVASWYSALTTNFIGSVVEESTWAITSALATVGLGALLPHYQGLRRRSLVVAMALNVAYVAFMVGVDVPMYFGRWRQDQAAGRHYLTLAEGWADAQDRRVVTHSWEHWRQEIPWMSLYFSAGVWISLGLAQAAARRGEERDRLAAVNSILATEAVRR